MIQAIFIYLLVSMLHVHALHKNVASSAEKSANTASDIPMHAVCSHDWHPSQHMLSFPLLGQFTRHMRHGYACNRNLFASFISALCTIFWAPVGDIYVFLP